MSPWCFKIVCLRGIWKNFLGWWVYHRGERDNRQYKVRGKKA